MINRVHFFDVIRKAHGSLSQGQVDGCNIILDGIVQDPEISITQAAYILATAYHETAHTMQPIHEYGPKTYFDKMYDPVYGSTPERRERAKNMGNVLANDGYKFRGRGYVQLTWRGNYIKFGNLLGVNLELNPDLALEPRLSEQILRIGMRDGLFTGRKLSEFINEDKKDYKAARRVVNGTFKDELVAGHAFVFEKALS